MNALPAEIVEFVRLSQRVSTNFTVTLPSREVFDAVMTAMERANSFDPREVAQTIGSLFDNAMRVTFGAEGSPVLYIEVPFFTHQRITAPHWLRRSVHRRPASRLRTPGHLLGSRDAGRRDLRRAVPGNQWLRRRGRARRTPSPDPDLVGLNPPPRHARPS
ncbi:hypothetical protein [Actinophytocola glycyrrhizae]|uniref:Uncharacterized protein n=1 Tax=Actinophytocola glycyrrhizae TaxID=2044873 RepID=A0ABV9SC26_9PSEU